jgi:hypothetical protein
LTGIDGQHHHNNNNNNMPAPSFGSTMENITVIKGRDASFTCVVLNIGPHRVISATTVKRVVVRKAPLMQAQIISFDFSLHVDL